MNTAEHFKPTFGYTYCINKLIELEGLYSDVDIYDLKLFWSERPLTQLHQHVTKLERKWAK